MKFHKSFLLAWALMAVLATAVPAPTAEPPAQPVKTWTRADFDAVMTRISN